METKIEFRKRDVERLKKLAEKYNKKNIDQQLNVTVNKAATKLKSATSSPIGMSQTIRKNLNVKAKDLKKWLTKTPSKNKAQPSAKVSIVSKGRLPLKYFGAKQNKKGVSYKIEKKGKRQTATSRFGPNIAKLGNHVYRRTTDKRTPIVKVWGISVWAYVMKNGMEAGFKKTAKKRLRMELKERIRFLRKTGWGSKKRKKKRKG